MNENNNSYGNEPYFSAPVPENQEYDYYYQSNQTQPGHQQSFHSSGYQQNFTGQQVAYSPVNQQNSSSKSKLVAGLLGIFLGGLGVHNFYLGHIGKAVVQLLISLLSFGFLAAISCIWGLIEGILILTSQPGSSWNADARGIPLKD